VVEGALVGDADKSKYLGKGTLKARWQANNEKPKPSLVSTPPTSAPSTTK